MHFLAIEALAQVLDGLAQAIGHGFRSGRHGSLLDRARCRIAANLENQEAAFECAVVERIAFVCAQADGATEILIRGDHGKSPAIELFTRRVADRAIGRCQGILLANALAIRRIADEQARSCRIGRAPQVFDRLPLEAREADHSGLLRIALGLVEDIRILIHAEKRGWQGAQSGFGAHLGLGTQGLPGISSVAEPTEETKVASTNPWCHIGRHQRRFNHQRAGSAHGIDQRSAILEDFRPPGAQQHGAGQVFLERRFALANAIAAPMQGRAGQIQREQGTILAQQQVQPYARLFEVNAGTIAVAIAELVDYRILDLLRQVARVPHQAGIAHCIDGQGAVFSQVCGPVDRLHAIIKRVFVGGGKLAQGHEDATGQA